MKHKTAGLYGALKMLFLISCDVLFTGTDTDIDYSLHSYHFIEELHNLDWYLEFLNKQSRLQTRKLDDHTYIISRNNNDGIHILSSILTLLQYFKFQPIFQMDPEVWVEKEATSGGHQSISQLYVFLWSSHGKIFGFDECL